jgi:hypothetical protein
MSVRHWRCVIGGKGRVGWGASCRRETLRLGGCVPPHPTPALGPADGSPSN